MSPPLHEISTPPAVTAAWTQAMLAAMDKPLSPTPDGCRFSLHAAGEAWSWRLTTPEGSSVAGLAPDRAAARRSAAFAAFVVSALERTRRRRF